VSRKRSYIWLSLAALLSIYGLLTFLTDVNGLLDPPDGRFAALCQSLLPSGKLELGWALDYKNTEWKWILRPNEHKSALTDHAIKSFYGINVDLQRQNANISKRVKLIFKQVSLDTTPSKYMPPPLLQVN